MNGSSNLAGRVRVDELAANSYARRPVRRGSFEYINPESRRHYRGLSARRDRGHSQPKSTPYRTGSHFFREGIRDGYAVLLPARPSVERAAARLRIAPTLPAGIFSLRSLLESLRLGLEPIDPSPTIDQAVNGGLSATIRARTWITCLA